VLSYSEKFDHTAAPSDSWDYNHLNPSSMKRSYGDHIGGLRTKTVRKNSRLLHKANLSYSSEYGIRREQITRVIRQVYGKMEHKIPRQNYSLIYVLPRRRVTDNTTNHRHRNWNSSRQFPGNACLILSDWRHYNMKNNFKTSVTFFFEI
jgi:hypothetical protein